MAVTPAPKKLTNVMSAEDAKNNPDAFRDQMQQLDPDNISGWRDAYYALSERKATYEKFKKGPLLAAGAKAELNRITRDVHNVLTGEGVTSILNKNRDYEKKRELLGDEAVQRMEKSAVDPMGMATENAKNIDLRYDSGIIPGENAAKIDRSSLERLNRGHGVAGPDISSIQDTSIIESILSNTPKLAGVSDQARIDIMNAGKGLGSVGVDSLADTNRLSALSRAPTISSAMPTIDAVSARDMRDTSQRNALQSALMAKANQQFDTSASDMMKLNTEQGIKQFAADLAANPNINPALAAKLSADSAVDARSRASLMGSQLRADELNAQRQAQMQALNAAGGLQTSFEQSDLSAAGQGLEAALANQGAQKTQAQMAQDRNIEQARMGQSGNMALMEAIQRRGETEANIRQQQAVEKARMAQTGAADLMTADLGTQSQNAQMQQAGNFALADAINSRDAIAANANMQKYGVDVGSADSRDSQYANLGLSAASQDASAQNSRDITRAGMGMDLQNQRNQDLMNLVGVAQGQNQFNTNMGYNYAALASADKNAADRLALDKAMFEWQKNQNNKPDFWQQLGGNLLTAGGAVVGNLLMPGVGGVAGGALGGSISGAVTGNQNAMGTGASLGSALYNTKKK